jgi:hypothetical protein
MGFCIISVYVDDLNIGNPKDIDEARKHLNTEFEMKDLCKTKYCLGLQLEHRPSGILVHQSAYIQKILEKFNMDKSYPIKTPMVVHTLEIGKDPFRPRDIEEKILGPKITYLSVIGALMYLANCTRLDIAFVVNLLARQVRIQLAIIGRERSVSSDNLMAQRILVYSSRKIMIPV